MSPRPELHVEMEVGVLGERVEKVQGLYMKRGQAGGHPDGAATTRRSAGRRSSRPAPRGD